MPFLHDTFTDTDTTLLKDHTPDIGGTWEEMGYRGAYKRRVSDGEGAA